MESFFNRAYCLMHQETRKKSWREGHWSAWCLDFICVPAIGRNQPKLLEVQIQIPTLVVLKIMHIMPFVSWSRRLAASPILPWLSPETLGSKTTEMSQPARGW
jgi:hypothetical protein